MRPMSKDKKLSNEERLKIVIPKAAELLAQWLRDEIPASGPFQRRFVSFSIYGTENEAVVSVERSLTKGEDMRLLQLGAHRRGSDMLVSYFLKTDTNAGLADYLLSPDTAEEWVKAIEQLSEKVDEKW